MVCYFRLSLDSPKLLKMIKASKSPDWPGGMACNLKKRSMKKCRPDNITVFAEMTTKLLKLKLAKRQDLEKLEDEITVIENECRCIFGKSTQKAFVVKTGGAHYADVNRSESLYKRDHTTTIDLIKATSKCCQIVGGDISNNDDYRVCTTYWWTC